MASKGRIDVALNALPEEMRVPLRDAFYEVLDSWRLGDATRAENALWFGKEFTTAAVANAEFAVAHGMESAPGKFVPVMRMNEAGNQLVPLTVSRAADATYAYFKSSSTSAVCSGYFE